MPSPNFLHQLRDLYQSAPKFPSCLTNLFGGRGYGDYVAGLQSGDLSRLIEHLDNALNVTHPTNPAFCKRLRELRAICGTQKVLPRSCMFPNPPPITSKWPIASGSSCDVYEGFLGDSKVSVKRLRIYSNDSQERAKRAFCQEAVVWKRLDHPNIVPLLGTTVSPFQLISVYMTGGELSEYINAHPYVDRLGLLSDVADGLSYLHSTGIAHGDLKGPSILVDDIGHARLTDFGLSAVFTDFESCGSIGDGHAVQWAAPEILEKKCPVGNRSDVYSFAMVVIEAFTGKAPFPGIAPTTVAVGVLSGNRPTRPTHPDLTNDLWEITKRCWDQDSQHRPDILEVVCCLRNTTGLLYGRTEMDDVEVADDATLESAQQAGSLIRLYQRPSCWAPVFGVLQRLYKFGTTSPERRSASDADNAQYAKLECEKPIDTLHQSPGALNTSRRERLRPSGQKTPGRPQTDHQRSAKDSGSANRTRRYPTFFKTSRKRSS